MLVTFLRGGMKRKHAYSYEHVTCASICANKNLVRPIKAVVACDSIYCHKGYNHALKDGGFTDNQRSCG